MLFKGSHETAAASYGGNVDFLKTSLSSEGCLPVAEHHTLIIDVSAELGSTLPYQEQFEIGGADFLLGYPLPGYHRRGFVGASELGASATYRWMMTEYQLNAVKAVHLVLSGGAANVWNARDGVLAGHQERGEHRPPCRYADRPCPVRLRGRRGQKISCILLGGI